MRLTHCLTITLVIALPAAARAQLPGAPVLQNAFSNPGVTVGANYAATSGDVQASLVAAAVAWAPGTGRFQLSAGFGRLTPKDGDGTSVYGARVAVPLFSFAQGRIGVAPFAGVGSGSRDSTKLLQVPAGLGAGWRTALGATRALSLYATATYLWSRTTVGDLQQSDGRLRGAVAADVTVVRNLGLTLGYESGSEAGAGESGPTGPVLGVGLSWAFR